MLNNITSGFLRLLDPDKAAPQGIVIPQGEAQTFANPNDIKQL